MKQIDFIIGLPGSGKTHLLDKYDDTWLIVDDASMNFLDMTKALLSDSKKIVLVDPKVCSNSSFDIRKELSKYCRSYKLNIICFENNLDQCLINSINRKDKTVSIEWIKWLSSKYDLDKFNPSEILKVYND